MATMTKSAKARTKSEVTGAIADETGLTKREVASVFEAMAGIIKKDIGRRGPGQFTVPGLMKIRVKRKPATKARKGTNPFTGEACTFAAKPARSVVKVRPLKALKDLV